MSVLVHGAAIALGIGLVSSPPAPVEHPHVGLIQVFGGVPLRPIVEETAPTVTIEVDVVPPPERVEPPEFLPPPRPIEEPPPPDPLDLSLVEPIPEVAWDARLRAETEPVEIVAEAPPQPASTPGRQVDPMPIDELNEPPPYPPRAIQLRLQGRVLLRVVVDAGGRVLRCAVVGSSSSELLDHAAVAAVERWVFRDGPGALDLPIDFVLTARGGVAMRER